MDVQEVIATRSGKRLVTRVRVRLAETDAQGVAYYGSFFVYFEVCRLGLLRAAGFDLAHALQGGSFYIVHADCDYKSFARYNDEIRIESVVERLGRSSVHFRHTAYVRSPGDDGGEERLCALAGDTLVWLDASSRPAPIPAPVREALEPFLCCQPLWPDGRPRRWRVVVGSENAAKIEAARAVMARVDPSCTVTGRAVDSGVPAQPYGHDETRQGAVERARRALAAGDGDLGVGFEGGLVVRDDTLYVTCWCALLDRAGKLTTACSAELPLPATVRDRLRAAGPGAELGPVIDALAGKAGFGRRSGAIGLLTAGLADRRQAWEQAMTYALAPWLRADLYDPA